MTVTPIHEMRVLQEHVVSWAAIALPSGANHLKKIHEEMEELMAAPADENEMADVLLALTIHAAYSKVDLFETGSLQRLHSDLMDWVVNPDYLSGEGLGKLQEKIRKLNGCPTDPEAMFDALLALLKYATTRNVDLCAAAYRKFEVVKQRRYGEPDSNGISRHLS